MKPGSLWLRILAGVAVALFFAAGVYVIALYWVPGKAGPGPASRPHDHPGAQPAGASDIAFWTCVMHPSVRRDGPGQCPVCNMDLTPVKRGAGLTLTQRQKDLVPVRTDPVGYHRLAREIRTVGTLTYNERKVAVASTRVSGWIERLYVDFAGTRVRLYYACPDHPEERLDAPGACPKDGQPLKRYADHLVEIYSPELLGAQEEYLQALQAVQRLADSDLEVIRTTARATVTSTEAKLRLLGLTEEQIADIRRRGRVVTTLTLFTPLGGTVIELKALLGQHVKASDPLFKIADLTTLWMLADVYEYELPWIHRGMDVEITGDSFPGRLVTGNVAFIYPYLHTETRTVKVLVEVPNAGGDLKPGMAVTARLRVALADQYRHEHRVLPAYACPMHPWITSDAPGQCSICGMALEATRPPAGAATKTVLTCGMPGHPVFDPGQAPADGKCPICGMTLKPATVPAPPPATFHEAMGRSAGELHFAYSCPDHPGTIYDGPGTCPVDGKTLVMTDAVLAVPRSAVIDTGERAVVYVDLGEGGYVARTVSLGPEGWVYDSAGKPLGRYVPVLSGVERGEMVVTRGSFLIDSQSQITGAAAQAYGGALGGEKAAPAPRHQH